MFELTPDITFKKELEAISGAPLNACMQCGTCSVVCTLSPEEKPFPRKEMAYAAWGMPGKLTGNPDIWLCHQCGDCSTHCPRGVKPADLLAGVRQLTYRHYARPRFLYRILSQPAWLPVAILVPVVIIAGIMAMAGTLRIPEGAVNYSKLFPHAWLNTSFTLLTFLAYGVAFSGWRRFWKDLQAQFPHRKAEGGFFRNLRGAWRQILAHERFGRCGTGRRRRWSHMLVFYGFVMLLVLTLYAIYTVIAGTYPLKITDPFKIMGNVASVMLVVGLVMMMWDRLTGREVAGHSTYSDWLLLVSLLLLTLSGVVIQMARFLEWQAAYPLYFFHLVCVWFVIIYLPFTKFGHMVYRTIAMTYAYSSLSEKKN